MIWPKRPPLAFSLAEASVAEMSGPKRPRPKCPWPKCPTFDLFCDKMAVQLLPVLKSSWIFFGDGEVG